MAWHFAFARRDGTLEPMFSRRHDPVADQLVDLDVSAAAAQRLSQAGTLLHLAPGTTLCTAGERGTQAFLLLDGRATVHTATAAIPVGAGAVVGELATLDTTRHRNATVVTDEDTTVLVFDVGTFRSLAVDDDLRGLLAPERAAA